MAPPLKMFLSLDDAAFRAFFSGSPVKRIGRDRFMRNVLIAAGNSGAPDLLAQCEDLLADASPLVRGAAVWTVSQLAGASRIAMLGADHASEPDITVRDEWRLALKAAPSVAKETE